MTWLLSQKTKRFGTQKHSFRFKTIRKMSLPDNLETQQNIDNKINHRNAGYFPPLDWL